MPETARGQIFVINGGTIGEYATSGATVNAALITGLNVPLGNTPWGIAVVPEPSSLVLAALGIAALAACGWRLHIARFVTA
jgi:PEP-CTERM motif